MVLFVDEQLHDQLLYSYESRYCARDRTNFLFLDAQGPNVHRNE